MAKRTFKHFTPRDKPKKRGPRQHKKNLNKHEKRQKKIDKIQRPGSNLILELNLIKKAWAGYATLNIKAPGIKKIIAHGTRTSFDKD